MKRSGDGVKGTELKYYHQTVGFMLASAWIIEKNGGKGVTLRAGGGTVVDALNYFLTNAYFPDKRQDMTKKQRQTEFLKRSRDNFWSMGYLEYARDSGISRSQSPLLYRALVKRGASGFFAGFHGGYTSCILGD